MPSVLSSSGHAAPKEELVSLSNSAPSSAAPLGRRLGGMGVPARAVHSRLASSRVTTLNLSPGASQCGWVGEQGAGGLRQILIQLPTERARHGVWSSSPALGRAPHSLWSMDSTITRSSALTESANFAGVLFSTFRGETGGGSRYGVRGVEVVATPCWARADERPSPCTQSRARGMAALAQGARTCQSSPSRLAVLLKGVRHAWPTHRVAEPRWRRH